MAMFTDVYNMFVSPTVCLSSDIQPLSIYRNATLTSNYVKHNSAIYQRAADIHNKNRLEHHLT